MLLHTLLIALGYLAGSLASAVITCKLMGRPDPRTQGSGNPGATNVLRLGGKKAAVITLIGDLLKGLLPVLLGKLLGVPAEILGGIAFAAFLGHLYPIFFGFKGGKGVATAFGAMLGLAWMVALAVLATWLLMAFTFRYSSLAALTSAILAPLYGYLLSPAPPIIIALASMSLLLIWRHQSNIRNLLAGTETKIGERKKEQD